MTKAYYQLTLEQRYKIEAYLNAGKTQTQIATLIGVNKSTISRELKRNIPKRGFGAKIYIGRKAHAKATARHSEKTKCIKFSDDLKSRMKILMENEKYSPELVKATWLREGVKGVSHETMYKFIWDCKHKNKRKNKPFKNLYKVLKHGKRHRKRGNYKDSRGSIPNRVSIDKRPEIVNERTRFGDFEADLVMGKNHKSALLVIVDRTTLKMDIQKLKTKNANDITSKIIKRMSRYKGLKTMTFDNDKAFTNHEEIAKALKIDIYFTRPYTSQDKGTIENRNGVLRQFFPKKTDFNLVSYYQIRKTEQKLNNRPIRKFGYKTPNEVYLQLMGKCCTY